MTRTGAVVVGAGPNGLAAAITLAEAGCDVLVLEARPEIGGGTRTAPLTLPGYLHDVCAAFHPLGAASPFFAGLDLEGRGVRWVRPEIAVAHPLGGERAAALWPSLEQTADRLGGDGPAWRRLMRPLTERGAELGRDLLQRRRGRPAPPPYLARGILAAMRGGGLRTPAGRALWAGIAAHAMTPLRSPAAAAAGLALGALAHIHGWPLIAGGTQRLTEALAGHFLSRGGTIATGRPVRGPGDLPPARVALFDLHPAALAGIYGRRLPRRARRRIRRGRDGPAAYKADYALAAPIPWTAPECHRAGVVHLGGEAGEIEAALRSAAAGRVARRPFILVGQQSRFDPGRAPPGRHTAWVYASVPNGYRDETREGPPMRELIEEQIERYAPGFGEAILARNVLTPADLEEYNPNYRGGDIAAGAMGAARLLGWNGPLLRPYRTGIPGAYLCSAAAPPGPGVHGMCGVGAASQALHDLFR